MRKTLTYIGTSQILGKFITHDRLNVGVINLKNGKKKKLSNSNSFRQKNKLLTYLEAEL